MARSFLCRDAQVVNCVSSSNSGLAKRVGQQPRVLVDRVDLIGPPIYDEPASISVAVCIWMVVVHRRRVDPRRVTDLVAAACWNNQDFTTAQPLKLAFFHSTLPASGRKPGGVEVFVHRLANRLIDRGHEVTVFTFGPAPSDAYYRVVKAGSSWLGERRLARLTLAPLVVNRLPQKEFDVLHLHGDDWCLLPRRVPSVRTFYGSALCEARTATSTRRRVAQAIIYPLELVASRLATASFDIGSPLPRGYRTDGSLALAVNPVESCRSRPRDRPTLLFVGTWHGRKRGEFLADTFERLVLPRHPTAELLMVSDHCVERPGITWVRCPSDGELASLYRSAWVFCLPSTYEGFGLPYLEACTHGIPVVATPNAGSRYVLARGAGLLVEDAGLGPAVAELLADPAARARLAEAGRVRARDFSWSRVLEEHEAAYALAVARFVRC